MGSRGPAGKRSDQRHGHRTAAEQAVDASAPRDLVAEPPVPADEEWHPVARRWYEALGESGQSQFYTASDWATAYVVAESMSRDLSPRYTSVKDEAGEPIVQRMPINGSSLTAYLKAMNDLYVTEGARRRASIELRSSEESDEGAGKAVSRLSDARARMEKRTG